MKTKSLIESFNIAVHGIIQALKEERNMKIHIAMAILVLVSSLFFDFTRMELLMLFFAISLVIMAEMFNTAIERVVDLVTDKYHPLAKAAKDIAAGGVLIAAINSVIVGYLLFFEKLVFMSEKVIIKISKSPIHLTFVALILVIILTVLIKTVYSDRGGTPFQGGIVSGHASISFCIATIIAFLSQNILVVLLAYGLAILVGESRIEGEIHSLREVIFGSVLGIIVGILIFQLTLL